VIAQAIRLDDEAVVREPEVHSVAEDPVFREGQREACGKRQGSEEGLQVRVGESERVPIEHRPQGLHSRHPDVAVERNPERLRVDEIELVRLVDRSLQPEDLQFGGEVDQRLHRMRHRDAEADDHARLRQFRSRVDRDPAASDHAPPPDGDVDPAVLLVADPPELAGTPMTQRGLVAAHEHSGHPAPVWRQLAPSHGIDAVRDVV
jgi:hypothetical protein